jgi:hypothetical protein
MATVWLERHDCAYDRLPGLCLKCGRRATCRVTKTFHWLPPWVYLLLLVHVLLFFLAAAVTHRSQKVTAPMCEEHRKHWATREWIIVGSLVLLVVGIILLVRFAKGLGVYEALFLVVTIGGSLVLWVILVVAINRTAVRAKKINEQGMQLTGVSDEFADAYLEQQRQCGPDLPDLDQSVGQRWGERGRPEASDPGRYQRDGKEREGYREGE